MWRLKIAEGGNHPYLYSTNNFVGRQTWEFDPDYGTPEERAEVEQARLDFWNNRRDVKPSSDVLWRMQVSPLLPPSHPPDQFGWFALGGLAAIGKTYENCPAIQKAVNFLLRTQREDGGWGESYKSISMCCHGQ